VQVLPIERGRPNIVAACHAWSSLWDEVQQLELTGNQRVKNCRSDTDTPGKQERLDRWSTWLARLGDGALGASTLTTEGTEELSIRRVRLDGWGFLHDGSLAEFVAAVYPGLEDLAWAALRGGAAEQLRWSEFVRERALLAPLHVDVELLNNAVLARMPGDEYELFSTDSARDDAANTWPPELCNRFNPPNVPPHCLRLKRMGVVMCIRNIATTRGLCNGTRLIVLRAERTRLHCQIVSGKPEFIGTEAHAHLPPSTHHHLLTRPPAVAPPTPHLRRAAPRSLRRRRSCRASCSTLTTTRAPSACGASNSPSSPRLRSQSTRASRRRSATWGCTCRSPSSRTASCTSPSRERATQATRPCPAL
jgi:hypothetical protein